MNIRLRLYANLEEKMPSSKTADGFVDLALPDDALIKDVLDMFDISYEEVYVILIDGRHASMETPLTASAELCIFPPIVGG